MDWTQKVIIMSIIVTIIVLILIIYFISSGKKRYVTISESVKPQNVKVTNSFHLERVDPDSEESGLPKNWVNGKIAHTYLFRPNTPIHTSGNDELRKSLGVITLKEDDKVKLDIPRIDGYWELCMYSYPQMKLVKQGPKVNSVTLTFGDKGGFIQPGDYVFVIFTQNYAPDSWNFSKVIEIGNFPDSNPLFVPPKECKDDTYYNQLEDVVPTIFHRVNGYHYDSSITSKMEQLYPKIGFVNVENVTFTLKRGQIAYLLVPNRKVTSSLDHRVIINGIIRSTKEDGKFYELYKVENQESPINAQLVTYDMIDSQESLPMYVYIMNVD